ncbi:MAG: DUF502 domain-containing protein [Candidatus Marinimicrobia bacterium]|nr:DUF502 domain-containing protein [Candidatus Neomarinimicrobiota bacterium]
MTNPTGSFRLRRIFLTGILTAIPIYITVQVLRFLFGFMDRILAPYLERIIGTHIPGLGLLMMLVSLFLLGLLVTNFLGRRLYTWFEKVLLKIPIASTIYTTSKQIVQTFSPENRDSFRNVIWLEYPRKGIWTLGFVTGSTDSQDGVAYYNIFIATTPNPTSGFVLFVPKHETIPSGMTVEEGFKLLISGGMLAADQQAFVAAEISAKRESKDAR